MFVTWKHDPHGDHEASAIIVRLALQQLPRIRLFEYPVWAWSLPTDGFVSGQTNGFRLARATVDRFSRSFEIYSSIDIADEVATSLDRFPMAAGI